MQRTILSVATASTVCLRCRILAGGPSLSLPLSLPGLQQCTVATSRARVIPAPRSYWSALNSARPMSTSITGLPQASSSSSSSSSSPSSTPSSSPSSPSPSPSTPSPLSPSSVFSLPPDPAQSHSSAVGLKRSANWREGWFEGNHRAFADTGANEGGEYEEMAVEGGSSQGVGMVHGQGSGRDREEFRYPGGRPGRPEKQVETGTEVEMGVEKRSTVRATNQAVGAKGEQAQGGIETTIGKPLHQDHEPPDERTVNLGTTIRTLQSCLPTLLSSPSSLPTSTLSPNIKIHLFPSSHPNLPTARGRVAYKTALWTAPFVWGQLPGRVRLEIVAARVVKPCEKGEQLRVRWRAVPSSSSTRTAIPNATVGDGDGASPTHPNLFPANKGETDGGFTGLFIFTFDDKGRILSHTIEHADEGWRTGKDQAEEAGLGFLGVAEWLLKKAKEATAGEGVGGRKRTEPGFVFLREAKGQEKEQVKEQEWRRE